jgi:hypothetical protein
MTTEPAEPAEIDLGRSALVTVLEKIGCDAIQLTAEPSAAKVSALTGTDPLSLMEADPSDARFVGE